MTKFHQLLFAEGLDSIAENESLQELLDEFSRTNNLHYLKKLLNRNRYRLLGEGEYRIVYDVGHNMILKIARPGQAKAIKSNVGEIENFRCLEGAGMGHYLPELYTYDTEGKWIITEKVRTFSSGDEAMKVVKKLMGFDFILENYRGIKSIVGNSNENEGHYLSYLFTAMITKELLYFEVQEYDKKTGKPTAFFEEEDYWRNGFNNPLATDLQKIYEHCPNVEITDFHKGNLGTRDGTDLVFIDLGVNSIF